MKKLLFVLALALPLMASGALRNQNSTTRGDAKNLLNKSGSVAAKVRLGNVLDNQLGAVQGHYSFAVSGGAIGAISLLDDDGQVLKLPANAVIKNVIIDVITVPTSLGSATVSFGAVSGVDLKAATAIASITGDVQGIPNGAVGNMIKLTSEKTITMTVAVAALTAGKLNVVIEYVVSE